MTVKKIETLRANIRERRAEIAEIEAQPASRASVAAQVTADVDRWALAGRAHALAALRRVAAGQAGSPLSVPVVMYTSSGPVSARVDLAPVLGMLMGRDALLDALTRDIDAVPTGLDPAPRAERLQSLRAALLDLEIQEEALITAIEAAGEFVARRPDADPRALLS